MKKAIVTGGSGAIGTHLCAKLRAEGYFVSVYDRKMPEFGYAPAHEYFIYDLRNSPDYYAGLHWRDADELYQLAAEMGGASYVFTGEHDAEIMHSSAQINLNVLEAARQAGIPKIFFASSACVYESLDGYQAWADEAMTETTMKFSQSACREDMAGNPDSKYGLEKWFSESLYASYAKNYGIDAKVGRFHNVMGEYGTWRGGREKAPAAFCRKIAEVTDGGTIDCFGDGEQTRSFIHGTEAAEATFRLMQSDFQGPMNIGSSEMVSINQMIAMLADISGKTFSVNHIPGPLGVRGRNSCNSLIEEKLGWKSTASLRSGLERLYPWIKEQVDKARANK